VVSVDIRRRQNLLEFSHGILACFRDAGAGQNIVKLVEQNPAPCGFKRAGRAIALAQRQGHRVERFGFVQAILADAVGAFDARLRGVAAGKYIIELVVNGGEFVAVSFELFKEVVHRSEPDRREQRPRGHFGQKIQIAPGRTAAVIADAIHLEILVGAICFAERRNIQEQIAVDGLVIPGRVAKDEHLGTGGSFPVVDVAGIQSAAVVVVFHAAIAQNFGQIGGVAKGIRLKVQPHGIFVDLQQPGKITAGVKQVARHCLATGHVLVVFHPA